MQSSPHWLTCPLAMPVLVSVLFSLPALADTDADTRSETAATQAAEESEGWRSLFNGTDLTGWRGKDPDRPARGWVVQEGELVRVERGEDIWTAETFGDFVIDLEFLTQGNSGVFFRKPDAGRGSRDRLEIQIHNPRTDGKPRKNSCGALYDCVAPTAEVCRKDEWNRLILTSAENRVEVVLNGVQIIDVDLNDWSEPGKNPDGTENKFPQPLRDFAREGHIGFQDHGAEVRFRNIRIKPLP
jgi:hypothetical protein